MTINRHCSWHGCAMGRIRFLMVVVLAMAWMSRCCGASIMFVAWWENVVVMACKWWRWYFGD